MLKARSMHANKGVPPYLVAIARTAELCSRAELVIRNRLQKKVVSGSKVPP
jgi:hypothetical protein